ncbi:putative glycosyl transferase [Planktothrix agardhii CCAP 1459/11A]|uniref:Putative glycosyl transferase n=1 Tax=Planktothrix agardhii CCAP 1459/11A TaxID=282420 RepID=A0A479ZSQ8_PLAAG|nr:hypothetical protein [Planktothrix agardhii]GCL34368.2 putative glycosyl transferase [Planktothrix agardhii CCAP 1459/11A]
MRIYYDSDPFINFSQYPTLVKSNNIPVINGSQLITAIHQNHDYNHLSGRRLEAFQGIEAQQNQTFLQGHLAGNSADATVYLTPLSPTHTPKVSVIISMTSAEEETRRGSSVPCYKGIV